jgi:hypothetical protein
MTSFTKDTPALYEISWRQEQILEDFQIGTHGTLLDAQGKPRNREAVSNCGWLKGLNLDK